jgi:outer membrane protein OmpA-like peptidoglycan-associated protein
LRLKIEEEQRVSYAQGVLASYIDQRIHKHPSREIYPADIFFFGDESRLKPEGGAIVKEIARLNKERFPWSRIVVASYIKSKEKDSPYARDLARERARAIGQTLTIAGINPRRIEPRAIIVPEEIYVDSQEKQDRYAQAIEIILLDANG